MTWRTAARVSAAWLALAATPLHAHDFWIEPAAFTPEAGHAVGLRLRVGEHLQGEPVVLTPGQVKHFVVDDDKQRRPVAVRRAADPAGAFRVAQPGLQIVSYTNEPNLVDLAADKFEAYLAEEGLEHIVELRARRGQADASARELYVRCAKSLLWSGPVAAGAPGDRRLGLMLELVAERNPYARDGYDEMPLRLSYRDQPLAGALVVALHSARSTQRITARTDADGRVRLRLPPGRGLWLVKAVHMVDAPANADGAQWLSYWASLTFEAR